MLYHETPDGFEPWTGAAINDVRYPLNIEQLWSAEDLAALELYVPVDPGVPADKISAGSTVERVAGVVTVVYTLEDKPVASYTLTKRQIGAALIGGGITLDPDSWMTALMANISDPTTRALAVNDWNNAPFYARDNELFSNEALLTAAGMTPEQIDALWLSAKDLPA